MKKNFTPILFKLLLISVLVFASCKKKKVTPEQPQQPQPQPQEQVKMTLTTTKVSGDTIQLRIDAELADQNDVWIDLNNNQQKDAGEGSVYFGEFRSYILGASSITIYGKATYFECGSQNVTQLDVSKNTYLKILYCPFNQLTTLDITKNTELEKLWCFSNQLTALDVSNNLQLKDISCNSNFIEGLLDVSHLNHLKHLFCRFNRLSNIKISATNVLLNIVINNNQLSKSTMMHLLQNLPDRTGEQQGNVQMYSTTEPNYPELNYQMERHSLNTHQDEKDLLQYAKDRNWRVFGGGFNLTPY